MFFSPASDFGTRVLGAISCCSLLLLVLEALQRARSLKAFEYLQILSSLKLEGPHHIKKKNQKIIIFQEFSKHF